MIPLKETRRCAASVLCSAILSFRLSGFHWTIFADINGRLQTEPDPHSHRQAGEDQKLDENRMLNKRLHGLTHLRLLMFGILCSDEKTWIML